MIPIKIEGFKFDKIKLEYLNEKVKKDLFIDKRYKKEEKIKESIKKRNEVFSRINSTLNSLGIDKTIEEIFIADFNTLKQIKEKLDSKGEVFCGYKNNEEDKSNSKNKYVSESIYKELYKKYDLLDKEWLIDKLGITVCPYCNRSFINNRNKSTTAQLDHFYPRSKYPIFSLSICNLIPSCYACNHIKREQEIMASPYDNNIDFNKLKFSYIPLNSDYLNDEGNIEIWLKCNDKNIENNIKAMQIDSAYKLNNDYVFEILKKAKIYNDGFKEELLKNYSGLITSEDELNRLIFGNYTNIEDVSKRPLAKLTHDILKEIGII